jgi:hypothetical protein
MSKLIVDYQLLNLNREAQIQNLLLTNSNTSSQAEALSNGLEYCKGALDDEKKLLLFWFLLINLSQGQQTL